MVDRWPARPVRQAEACDRGGAGRTCGRDADTFVSCRGGADEHIPGRLAFDLYLARSNRQARAAEVARASRRSAVGGREGCCTPQGAGALTPMRRAESSAAVEPSVSQLTRAQVVTALIIMVSRRGSILDVMA